MGQNLSSDDTLLLTDFSQDDLLRHARALAEISVLTYEQFVKQLGELNKLSRLCLDANGKQLVFAVKKGTDSTILWKGTVRIGCVKVDPVTSAVDSYRLLNLAEFLQVFKTFQGHVSCIEATKRKDSVTNEQAGTSTNSPDAARHSENPYMTASVLLQEVDNITAGNSVLEKSNECCICLDSKPEVILPCAHSYCLPCIEQWNVNNKTCPICRERLETTDDTWVISEAPNIEEITAEICSSLDELSKLSDKPRDKA